MFDKLTAEDLTREADDYNAAREFEAAAEWSWCDCPSCEDQDWESHRAGFQSGDLGFRIFQD